MNPEQQQAILTLALLAAFADGVNDDREREQIRRLAESLGGEAGSFDVPALYRKVLLKQVSLKDAAAILVEPGHRQLAYEMAVCVCDADGRTTESERQFLADLAAALNLGSNVTEPANQQAQAMSEMASAAAPAAMATTVAALPSEPLAAATPSTRGWTSPSREMPPGPVVAATPRISDAEIDRTILNTSILNGALELLPQSWGSMAIIPLQIKMVYGIGKEYGYELDQGHIREFLATLGVGLTSQYLEQVGRKLLGGLLGKMAGGMAGHFGKAAVGIAFSFATTYALGQVAKRYYAGGRQMNSALLRDSFQNLLAPAKEMQAQYLPQIQQKAGNLDMSQIMNMVRGR